MAPTYLGHSRKISIQVAIRESARSKLVLVGSCGAFPDCLSVLIGGFNFWNGLKPFYTSNPRAQPTNASTCSSVSASAKMRSSGSVPEKRSKSQLPFSK